MDKTLTTTAEQSAVDELAVLFPNQLLEISGKTIEVCEYTLLQQMQHRARFEPFVQALRKALGRDSSTFDLDALQACVAEHYDDVFHLIALSVNQPIEWVQSLSGKAADELMMLWWTVNSDFFTRKAVQPLLEHAVKQHLKSVGAK
ncbi:DUF6631 family protein [Pasteurella multocida]|uniref:DUF6631 family protein n=1 Tax=Pasteurella multocida TaxID=747 RepID=UPI002BB3E58D|nr:DUF6631 family protein [Pasteurella multocida]MEB3470158.1 DUF6631 family protein [Pasteurella multocida]